MSDMMPKKICLDSAYLEFEDDNGVNDAEGRGVL